MQSVRCGAMAALVAVLALTLGCGADESASVSGTVTYDGKPVENGAIRFISLEGAGGTGGGTIKDGQYTATKVPIGKTQVSITGVKVVGKTKRYDTPDSPEMPKSQELLPMKYNAKTELTLDVKSGANEKNWELAK